MESTEGAAIEWLKQHLRAEEGCRRTAYRCTSGCWTIGIGHRLPAGMPLQDVTALNWTDEDIEVAFTNDVAEAIRGAASFAWWHVLSAMRQAAIAAMVFQLGRGGVAGFVRMAEEIKASRWHGAEREMRDSRWHRQTPRRCVRLAKVMRDGR